MRPLIASMALLAASAAHAHGGLSMDQDMCKLVVGPYYMHFAGYQEDAQRTEFCEDIPHKGQTIVVLDFLDERLRSMPTEVEIRRVRDGQPPEQGEVVYRLEPRVYPRGTLTLRHDFKEDGNYVGLVWAGDKRQYASVFPFAVGRDQSARWYALGAAALAALGAAGWFIARQRLSRDLAARGAA